MKGIDPPSSSAREHQLLATTTSHHVYIRDVDSAWLAGRLLESGPETALVEVTRTVGSKTARREQVVVKLQEYPNRALPPQNLNRDGSLLVVADMVDLPFLHEAAILYNLKARHQAGQPYTSTGSILVAVNPYQWIKSLYTEECMAEYSKKLVWERPVASTLVGNASSSTTAAAVAPHVYEISSKAYKGLARDRRDQSILVSGESGAGKTETVKICLQHIASVQRGPGGDSSSSTAATMTTDMSPIVQRILESNPLLEAFGNAKTIRNDNSSRFGKYIQLQFDGKDDPALAEYRINTPVPDCQLVGSKCEVYLLEKSRVVSHNPGERSYHIFYQLLATQETTKRSVWWGLAGKTNESFRYVGWTDTKQIEGVADGDRFDQTIQSLKSIGIRGDALQTLLRAICTVLQLGNLEFKSHSDDAERVVIGSVKEFALLSELTGIVDASKFEKAFTERAIEARGEVLTVHLTPEKSRDACDAFAKEVYARAFLWLVRKINEATQAKDESRDPACRFGTIGLLDIFGFESFQVNSFEQLCINYANERLQQKFTLDVFTAVTAEYKFEGIALDEIKYDDNEDVLQLIESRNGLLAMLNEECFRPNGNDSTFVRKTVLTNKQSPCLISEKMYGTQQFGIQHYAGPVIYDARGFVSKNTDQIPSALKAIALRSTNEIISKHLDDDTMIPGEAPPMVPTLLTNNHRGKSMVGVTVWSKFRTQLNSLMGRLEETDAQYIRCIKPNSTKSPLVMDNVPTVQQLRCAGVVAAVTISRSAFPNRIEHGSVLERFSTLWPKGVHRSEESDFEERRRADIDNLLTHALVDLEVREYKNKVTKAFVIGQTRTYFRAGALEFLESQRLDGMHFWAAQIQKLVRGYFQRRDYSEKRAVVIVIQAVVRMTVARAHFVKTRQQAIILQCWQRRVQAKREAARLRTYMYATRLQVRWRIYKDQSRFRAHQQAATTIQRRGRGVVYRIRYHNALEEKRIAASVALQLEKLRKEMELAELKRKEQEEKMAQEIRQLELKRKEQEEKKRREMEEYAKKERREMEEQVEMKRKEIEETELKLKEQAEKERREQDERDAQERLKKLADERAKMEQELRELRMEKELQELRNQIMIQQQQQLQQQQLASQIALSPRGSLHERIIPDVEPLSPCSFSSELHISESQQEAEMTTEQKTLMAESGKIIEFLRKENLRLKKKCESQRRDFATLKENNARLMEANASAGTSFRSLNQHAKQLDGTNRRLLKTVAQYRNRVTELHSDIKSRQVYYRDLKAAYKGEVEARGIFERAMLAIVDVVAAKKCDKAIHDLVLERAVECAKISQGLSGQQHGLDQAEEPSEAAMDEGVVYEF